MREGKPRKRRPPQKAAATGDLPDFLSLGGSGCYGGVFAEGARMARGCAMVWPCNHLRGMVGSGPPPLKQRRASEWREDVTRDPCPGAKLLHSAIPSGARNLIFDHGDEE